MQVQIEGLDVLSIAILVIFLGRFLTTHIAALQHPTVGQAAAARRGR